LNVHGCDSTICTDLLSDPSGGVLPVQQLAMDVMTAIQVGQLLNITSAISSSDFTNAAGTVTDVGGTRPVMW
jgi:hypothetical protein